MPMKSMSKIVCLMTVAMALVGAGWVMPVAAAQQVMDGMPKMSTPIRDLTIVVFDTETTGFSAAKDRIVEIGAVKIRNGEIVEERNWLINPQQPIPARVTKVHGISDAMVKDKPAFADIYADFQAFVGDAILVAHNARFDVDMMRAEVERANLETPANLVIDSLRLFRKWYPQAESHKLGVLADYLGLGAKGLHRGDVDSRFTALILFEGLKLHPACNNLKKLCAAAGGVMVF
jgi:DNA polymerase-3 subunit alpha (Gram-positive type)